MTHFDYMPDCTACVYLYPHMPRIIEYTLMCDEWTFVNVMFGDRIPVNTNTLYGGHVA